jgi:surfactin synthase thioesterase subunit
MATTDQFDLWVRRFHPAPDAPNRLLCLAHAGGSASYFFPASRALSPQVDVLAVQYPGRQDRRHERGIDTIGELADQLVEAIQPLTDRPLTLFGHSMGATLAFEVALRLQRSGVVPSGLFASGRRAPSRHRDERIHRADDTTLIAEIKQLNGTNGTLLDEDELIQMILPAIRTDYRAAETYRYQPGPKLSCPIFALVGDSDPKVTVDEARSWADHTTGPFDLEVFHGGHFYLNTNLPAVLDRISAHLAGAAAA